ncbi:hypothetical protein JM654_03860 [Microbacterium oxydans]|nr:hypothetical protein [Microbacterium oxydans]
MLQNLRAGWTDAQAAQSAFTGVAGSIGGLLRAVSDVSGLTRLGTIAKNAALASSRAFVSLATQVGGRLPAGRLVGIPRMAGHRRCDRARGVQPTDRVLLPRRRRSWRPPFVRLGPEWRHG